MSATILVVEDDDRIRETLKELLTKAGYEVRAVDNGESALTILDAEPIDLIITNLRLPRLGCRELIKNIRQLEQKGEGFSLGPLEIIVFTGYQQEFDEKEAWQEYDVFDYILKLGKHARNERILRTVARSLDRKRFRENIIRRSLPDEKLRGILQKMFAPEQVVHFERLSSGLSDAVVVNVLVENQNHVVIHRIVKLDSKDWIDQEKTNRRKIELTGLPWIHYPNIVDTKQLSLATSAIIYQHLKWTSTIIPFWEFYQNHDCERVCELLGQLFKELSQYWYQPLSSAPKRLSECKYHIRLNRHKRYILSTLSELEEIAGPYFEHWGNEAISRVRAFLSGTPIDGENLWDWKLDHWECLCHGDLNRNNLFVDSADFRLWFFIDFTHTDRIHYLKDFTELEAEIKFILMERGSGRDLDPNRISLWIDFHNALEGVPFGETPSFPERENFVEIKKAFDTVVRIRLLARQVTHFDELEYFISLLYQTLAIIRFDNVNRVKKIFALYCVNNLFDKLLKLY